MSDDGDSHGGNGDYDRPGAEKQITAEEVHARFEAASKATRRQQMGYWQACAFLEGDQWMESNSSHDRLRRMPRSEGQIQAVNNRLLPASVTVMAKLHRRPHIFECPPTSGDDAAVAGTRLGEAALADAQRRLNWDQVRSDADWMAWKGGTSLICLEWDAEAGNPIPGGGGEDEEEGPADGETLAVDLTPGTDTTSAPLVEGDVCVTALSVAEAFCEPGTKDINRGYWWIKAVVMPPKAARRLFDLDRDPEPDGKSHVKYDPAAWKDESTQAADMTLVLTLFERPNKGCAAGRVCTVIGDRVVEHKPWPFPWRDRLNVRPITCVPVDGRWNGQTVLWQAMSLQYLLNRCETAMAENQAAVGNAKPMIPEGALQPDFEWNTDPRDVIPFNPAAGKPEYLSPPSMPEWVLRAPEHYYLAIDDILGVHAISRGQAPAGVDSGVGLSFLGEQDDTPVGELARVAALAWSGVGSDVLEVYAKNVVETREAQVRQPKGPPQVMVWSGEMLAGQTVAEVPAESAAPRGRFAQLQLGMNLLDRGIFGPPGEELTSRRFLGFAEMPGGGDMLDSIDHAEAKAHRVVAKMFAGQVSLPADFDKFDTMIRVVNEARLSARYDESDPEVQSMFDDYAKACQALAEEEMLKQQARALANPAMAVAAQANEPPLAGNPDALLNMQAEQDKVQHRGANVGGADAPMAPAGPGDPSFPGVQMGADMAGTSGQGEGI